MTLASVLLCLVLGSSYLVAGMLAKYTSGDSEDDSSRVAKFSFFVSDVGDSHIVDLRGIEKPGDELTYSFSVNSNSEVSVSYDITLMVNGSMPLTATVNTATPLSVSVPGNDTGAEATRESAGTFTTNLVKAAPVLWDQKVVAESENAQGVVINSGIANACTGEEGLKSCARSAQRRTKALPAASITRRFICA